MKEIKNKFSGKGKRPVILIAPLDWGLGHATRCIPLIRYLLELNCEVIIGAEGKQRAVLQLEFPELRLVHLPGYRLNYSSSGWKTIFNIFFQIPKILTAINREIGWLNRFLPENQIDFIISDNRYGFRHPSVPSFFITHQLYIKSPFGGFIGNLSERLLQKWNYRLINKFSECWVPDHAGENNLAGVLSHPVVLPSIPVIYLGPLTRFYKKDTPVKNELMIILSGPEPQRTMLEDICVKELKNYHKPAILLRGLPGADGEVNIPSFNQVTIYNHLPSDEFNEAVNASQIIVSRSGYSTIMDIVPLKKSCVFIPTPGQPEQIYLAKYLADKKECTFFYQHKFFLSKALEEIISKGEF